MGDYAPFVGPFSGPLYWFVSAAKAVEWWLATSAAGVVLASGVAWPSLVPARYSDVARSAAIALAISVAWALAVGCRPLGAKTSDVIRTIVRYALAFSMLFYGFNKVFPNQFSDPEPHKLMQPFGEASPVALLWTFMGYSPVYTMFAGWLEVIGGMLLFWRRTTLLGALVLVGVLMNVVMLNFCYDAGVEVRAVHYLLMAAFLIAPDSRRLLDLLVLNRPAPAAVLQPCAIADRRLRGGLMAVKAVLIAAVISLLVSINSMNWWTSGTPDRLDGFYRVKAFALDGIEDMHVPDDRRWVRVAITARPHTKSFMNMQRANGDQEIAMVMIDRSKGILGNFMMPFQGDSGDFWQRFSRGGDPDTSLKYEFADDGTLTLEGRFRGAAVTARLARQPSDEFPLLHRKFDWRNNDLWYWR
ncbi:MAG: hypothetical protein ACKOEM_13040 [Planctomycetia bacterium]